MVSGSTSQAVGCSTEDDDEITVLPTYIPDSDGPF